MRIVKVGGSVASRIEEIVQELKETGEDILIVPGGWVFADIVREIDSREKLDPSHAHWMAIAAMDMYAYYISNFGVDTVEADQPADIEISGVAVLLPYGLLRKNDELPHSWGVTSDSIAVWLASRIGCREVVKVTDVDGIYIGGKFIERITASFLIEGKAQTCVDLHSPRLMRDFGVDMFICNGMVEGRVKGYIVRGRAKGTLIEGK